MAGITLAGAFFRLFQLWRVPVGYYFDEAAEAMDVSRIGFSFHPIYFVGNNGREPLFLYWAAPFVDVLGISPPGIRLAAAFMGIATIPAVYFCVRQLLHQAEGGRRARIIAVFSATGCAFLFLHVDFSRLGVRTISLPLMQCLAFGFLWLAVRRRRRTLFAVAGVLFAATLYTYTAVRVLPVVLAVYGVYWLVVERRIVAPSGLAVWLAGFAAGILPLAAYALTHLTIFWERTAGLAVTDPHELAHNALLLLELPVVRGGVNGVYNIIGMPLFDWVMSGAFVVGLAIWLTRLRRPVYVFIALWACAIAATAVFSPDAPYYGRLTGLVPPILVAPALALEALPRWIERLYIGRHKVLAWLPSVMAVLASAGLTYHAYFQVWAPSNDTYFWMMQDKVDAAAYIQRVSAGGASVFLAPLYARDYTFEAYDRGQQVQSFDPAQCSVLPPPGRDASYLFPPYDTTQPALVLPRLPAGAVERPIVNDLGQPVLIEVAVPGAALPAPAGALAGSFGGQIGLVRADGLPGAVRPGDQIRLTLVWRALGRPAADYTAFVHADGPQRLQQDHPPCGGSFGTSQWTAGEQVYDDYTLAVPRDAAPGVYRVTAGLYQLPGAVNLKLPDGSGELVLGSFEVLPA